MSRPRDRGSTLPLILGFVIIALLMVAGSVAAGQAFVQQRDLQDVCDGAAVAATSAADLDRQRAPGTGDALSFAELRPAVEAYLAREPVRRDVRVTPELSPDATTLTLTCAVTQPIAFGAMFGKGGGVRHVATSSARAPLS